MRLIILSTLLTLVLVSGASAQPVISLSSPGLSTLRVGDTATVDVMLSGLSAGDMLKLLAAEVGFNALHFGTPSVTSGGIIPDVAGFESDEFVDLAGATFDSLDTASTTDMITANGVFFSFDISAIDIGSGPISLDFADALGEDSLNSLIDGATAGAALSYSIIFPGDYDLDRDVDGFDFLTWQRGESPESLSASDLSEWEDKFGINYPSTATSSAVPEPSAILLLFSTLSCFCLSDRLLRR